MKFIQISYFTLTPVAMLIYVMFNGYPNLVEGTIMSLVLIATFYLLIRKDIR